MMEDVAGLLTRLGVTSENVAIYRLALTHRSYVNEHPEESADNERLEFLGDAVLDFVVGAYLYHRYPDRPEGELTTLRAALVRARTLAGFARQWEIDRYLHLGYGEVESGGRAKEATLSAAFEAVVGALYLDQGLECACALVEELIEPALGEILRRSLHKDAKSEFQMWAQATFNITPHYVVVAADGPDHAKTFTMQVWVGQRLWGEGRGSSKQQAAQAAAAAALETAISPAAGG